MENLIQNPTIEISYENLNEYVKAFYNLLTDEDIQTCIEWSNIEYCPFPISFTFEEWEDCKSTLRIYDFSNLTHVMEYSFSISKGLKIITNLITFLSYLDCLNLQERDPRFTMPFLIQILKKSNKLFNVSYFNVYSF